MGTTHVLKKGETLYRIARAYEVDLHDLLEVNGIVDPKSLSVGMELFVPGVARPVEVAPLPVNAPPDPPIPSPKLAKPPFIWPTKGVLYSRFGVRNGQRHDGIDIAAPEDTAIVAAGAGKVIFAGTQAGYGSLVILRHDNGLITLYAHASTLLVKEEAIVKAGTPIARVGRSGRTSGPHLHFEVREGTKPRNPLLFLR